MVVPNSCMCRRVAIAYFEMSECPNGTSNWTGPRLPKLRFALRRLRLRSARVVEPYASTTTSTTPAWMAAAACAAMNSHELPPTLVPSAQRGRNPQYSAISVGANRPVPHDPNPSTSAFVSPASAIARAAAWWCSSYAVLTSTRPQSDSAAPTIATRGLLATHLQAAGAAVEDRRVDRIADLLR